MSRPRTRQTRRALVAVDRVETLVHYAVAFLLLVIAVVVLFRTADHLILNRGNFAVQIANGINDLLFVVIVMELLRTVVAHLATHDFQLRSFLIIGIVSAVRRIVGVGATLTLGRETASTEFVRAQIDLGVSAGVVLVLAVSFLLITRSGAE